ncbi:MAG: L-threonylcarbamoyladenylate synthase [Proteobacteria bacterium]|nr:L-threonylcarbamoyladenylate synthase [Pseudomonadota bacterium]
MATILSINPDEPDISLLQQAVQCLRDGGIVLYPTETFYGLGVHYAHESALRRLFRIKERDAAKPVLLLIPDSSWIHKLSFAVPEAALTLASHFWPGPLTLVLRASPQLPAFISGDDKTVGMRISSNPVAHRLLTLFGDCITSTSANRAGERSSSSIQHIPRQLLNAIDLVIDAGETPGGSPSTVLDISVTPFNIVREGAVPGAAIRECLAPSVFNGRR